MKLLWLDIETTGLHPKDDRILEVGAIVTDEKLNEIARFQEVIYYPLPEILPLMDEWCLTTHSNSGLLEAVTKSSKTVDLVQTDLYKFIRENAMEKGKLPHLAGNSVHFDRSFLKNHMSLVETLLHYRHFDISSVKIAFEIMMNKKPTKTKEADHRSIADLENSIRELKELFGVELTAAILKGNEYGH